MQKNKNKQYETGNAKILESLTRLIAFDETLDQVKLNPPPDLTLTELNALQTNAVTAQRDVGNARADWRTIALDRALGIEKFAPLASQVVGQLDGRGAGIETIKDAMFYVRKLQGRRAKPKPPIDPNAPPTLDESEKGISASQQSAAAQLSIMFEFIDFIEAQTVSAGIKSAGLAAADLRAFAESVQAKHNASITAVADLTNKRGIRNELFYTHENNICDIAKRFKSLVRGEYGATSVEFKTVNAISFKKTK